MCYFDSAQRVTADRFPKSLVTFPLGNYRPKATEASAAGCGAIQGVIVEMIPIGRSSAIRAVGYDERSLRMRIAFQEGHRYDFCRVFGRDLLQPAHQGQISLLIAQLVLPVARDLRDRS